MSPPRSSAAPHTHTHTQPATDTTALTHELADLRQEVRRLADHAELRALFDRYVLSLDDIGTDSDPGTDLLAHSRIFTPDATFAFPIGTTRGAAGYTEFRRLARARWAHTHHLGGSHDIEVTGDHATLRAHQNAVHLHHGPEPATPFTVGGRYEIDAVRTPAGWRLHHVVFHVVTTTGDPLPRFAHTART
ncbi:nuclear transport factor 2 family protein (plasmid) [Streptomyces sp. BI20]|uniref:nuclear transport factor 2 family protein n=1 Tax=Streptomyces sp. BI20 TaxID=3403460 RepID=UPI003C74BB61